MTSIFDVFRDLVNNGTLPLSLRDAGRNYVLPDPCVKFKGLSAGASRPLLPGSRPVGGIAHFPPHSVGEAGLRGRDTSDQPVPGVGVAEGVRVSSDVGVNLLV